MPLPSLKLRLLNSKLAGNAHFELAQADVPADLYFTNCQLLSFHTESGTFLVCFVFMWPVFLSLFLIERSFLTRYRYKGYNLGIQKEGYYIKKLHK
jgi:hypothetical protein